MIDLLDRLISRTAFTEDGCWMWTGAHDEKGYGFVRPSGTRRVRRTHRVAYEELVGPIPEGLTLDHLCQRKPCWNPDHLEPITAVENWRRGPNNIAAQRRQKTHCPSGHPYDDLNTYVDKRGYRYCKACQRLRNPEHMRRRRLRKKAA